MRDEVTLVIPGRNAASTVDACLSAVLPLKESGQIREIIFVNDGSTDDTASRVARYPVRCLTGKGEGPGAARNLGYRAAQTPLVWFIDSDCVSELHALELLLERLEGTDLAGVGGSYGNMRPESLLACLIHEEIIERHRRMPREVNFLATFNVLYRREILEKVGGFDERFIMAQDAELAFRIRECGGRLGFEPESRVAHFHPDRIRNYLRTQTKQGYWRAWLYLAHPGRMGGDSYSGVADHAQPVLALASLGTLALAPFAGWRLAGSICAVFLIGLALTTLPMTLGIVSRLGRPRYFAFAAMSFLRSYARGFGLAAGTLSAWASLIRTRTGTDPS